MKNDFIRPLTKKELAGLYEISVKTLNNWIEEYPELLYELNTNGYYKGQKILTIKQIKIIFEYLGYPENADINAIPVPIRCYNKNELAEIYGISWNTLKSMLRDNQIEHIIHNNQKKLSAKAVKIIFKNIGQPYKSELN